MMNEADIRTVLAHPSTIIGSDGVPTGSRPHPRLYGTLPRMLGPVVRDHGVRDLTTAVRRMTGLPAARFQFAGRGTIRPGAFVLVVFGPTTIRDTGAYDDPCQFPIGLRAVLVNGVLVRDSDPHPGAGPRRGRE